METNYYLLKYQMGNVIYDPCFLLEIAIIKYLKRGKK